jgi:hypothetical protein
MSRDETPFNIPCPVSFCLAEIGQECRGPLGKPLRHWHFERDRTAEIVEAASAEAKRANAKLALTVSEVTDAWEADKAAIERVRRAHDGCPFDASTCSTRTPGVSPGRGQS